MQHRIMARRSLRVLLLLCFLVGAQGLPGTAYAQDTVNAPTAPVLGYSTYLGGSSTDRAIDVAVSATGEIFVLGETFSEDLLGHEYTLNGYTDLFIAKFNAAGSQLLYLTIIGGPDSDSAHAIAVDGQGNAYVTAAVYGSDVTFPTKNAHWPTRPSGYNGVLFKLNPQGGLVFSTYLPLDVFDAPQNLAVDTAGNAFVTGTVYGVMDGEVALRAQLGLFKLSPDGQTVLLEKTVGGTDNESGRTVAVDKNGAIYLAGVLSANDVGAFPLTPNAQQTQCGDVTSQHATYCYEEGVVAVLNAAGAVTYASYLGGSFTDDPLAIAADGKGGFVVTGETSSSKFPLVNPIVGSCVVDTVTDNCYSPHGFVSATHIQSPKAVLVYSTYLASTERESWTTPTDLVLDSAGNAYVTGWTNGKHIPVKDAVQKELSGDICISAADATSARFCYDGFLVRLTPTGALGFGTYLGGGDDDFLFGAAVNTAGSPFVTGYTDAVDFPTTTNAFQPMSFVPKDGVLARIDMGAIPQPITIVVDPAAPGGHVDVTVVSQPADAANVDASYPVGTVLKLTAVANPGYRFVGWGGDLNGTQNPKQFTVAGPMSISARFAQYASNIYVPAVKKP